MPNAPKDIPDFDRSNDTAAARYRYLTNNFSASVDGQNIGITAPNPLKVKIKLAPGDYDLNLNGRTQFKVGVCLKVPKKFLGAFRFEYKIIVSAFQVRTDVTQSFTVEKGQNSVAINITSDQIKNNTNTQIPPVSNLSQKGYSKKNKCLKQALSGDTGGGGTI